MASETADIVEHAATLLMEAADILREAAATGSANAEEWRQRALNYERASAALRQREVASPADELPPDMPRDGAWVRRESWLDPDDSPPWDEFPFDPSAADHVAWKDAVYAAMQQERSASLRPEPADIFFARLPFLSQVVLARLRRGQWAALFSVVDEGNDAYKARNFGFASPEVHRLNAVIPLNSTGRELAYFRYFMYVVRGDEGTFRLLEGHALQRAAPHVQASDGAALLEQIHPPTFQRVALDGGLIYRAWLLHAGTIFRCTFAVYPDGRVSMLEDESQLTVPALAR